MTANASCLSVLAASLAYMAIVADAPPLPAQDVVHIRNDDGQRVAVHRGRITEYDAQRLLIEVNGRIREFPTARVDQVHTLRTASHQEGDRLLSDQQFLPALQAYEQALADESRPWVQRAIRAARIRCADGLGRFDLAVDEFLQLIRQQPETRFFELIPLNWTSTSVVAALQADAQQWMASEEPMEALIGASWLIPTGLRAPAVDRLKALSHHEDSRIAHLATAQLWRTGVVTADAAELERWQQQLQRIPASLRAGPSLVLAEALARVGQHDRAAVLLMRLPIVHSDHYQLAAEALQRCGQLLVKMNRVDEANLVFGELGRDYAKSLAAAHHAAAGSQGGN